MGPFIQIRDTISMTAPSKTHTADTVRLIPLASMPTSTIALTDE